MTADGGTTWRDVTSELDTQYKHLGTTFPQNTTNPQVGYRIVTSGDEIEVCTNHLEQTSFAMSWPIPTTGTTVTRAEEVMTITSANHSVGTSQFTLAIKGIFDYVDNGSNAEITPARWWPSADNNVIWRLQTFSTDTGQWRIFQEESTVIDLVETSATYLSPGRGKSFHIAARHSNSDVNFAVDGNVQTANTTVTALPDLTTRELEIIENVGGIADFNGTLELVRLWETDGLVDADLGTATS